MKIEKQRDRTIYRIEPEEVSGEPVEGGVRIVASDGDGSQVEITLDPLDLADVINDAGLSVEIDDVPAESLTWNPQKNVLAAYTQSWWEAHRPRKKPNKPS